MGVKSAGDTDKFAWSTFVYP